MEDFRKDINAQHAPKTIIESTIERIHKEAESDGNIRSGNVEHIENSRKASRKKQRKAAFAGFGAFAVCLIFAVVISIGQFKPMIYNEMAVSTERNSLIKKDSVEISLEQYEQYLNVDLSKQLADYDIEKSYITVSYDKDGNRIKEDEGTFYLKEKGKTVILTISRNDSLAPEELISGRASNIDGVEVYIGKTSNTNQLVASFQWEDVNYYLSCKDISKKDFEKILKKLIK